MPDFTGLTAAFALAAATHAADLPPGFKAKADALVAESFRADAPGAVIIVTEHGKPVYRSARGLADVAKKTPITNATVFRYGSISKQFASATLMTYVQAGKIALDDPLSKYLPDYPGGKAITVAELLNHTSGVASYTGIPGWFEKYGRQSMSTSAMIDSFKEVKPDFAPGTDWSYNNSGYILVQALIEKVSGKPWHEAEREAIFSPLKLQSIRYGVDEPQIAGMAHGYGRRDGQWIAPPNIDMSIPGAAGAIVGDVGDLAAWADAFHHGRVVSANSYRAMTTPTKVTNGSTRPYGFGLELGDVRGRPEIGHSGGIFGFSTDSIYIPSADLFVAVLTNSDNPTTSPGAVARRLAALALGNPFPEFTAQPLDPAALKALPGRYKASDGERLVEAEDGKLYWSREGDRRSELLSAGADRYFFGPDTLDWVEFKGSGSARTAELHRGGSSTPLVASFAGALPERKEVRLSAADIAAVTGQYESPMGLVTISAKDGVVMVQLAGQQALPMRAESTKSFAVPEVGAKIEFNDGGLVIKQGGRDLPATRKKD